MVDTVKNELKQDTSGDHEDWLKRCESNLNMKFHGALGDDLEHCLREGRRSVWGRKVSCAVVGIDSMEPMNGGCGIDEGVLETVAHSVTEHTGPEDLEVAWTDGVTLLFKLEVTLLDTWLWGETLRRAIESLTQEHRFTAAVTVSLGMAASNEFGRGTIDRSVEAWHLAKDRGGNTIYTADMANVTRHLEAVAACRQLDVAQRHQQLLLRIAGQMGSVQTEHLTDHCQRVSDLCVLIAQTMQMSSGQIERLRIAGQLHDLGKCMIPEDLLSKPRTLSIEEWRIMARHEEFGVWIAEQLGLDPISTSLIQHHHRRHDACRSNGQPNTTEVQEWVQIGSAILCVADALVTMLSDRPYRPACSVGSALQELQRERGRQFHPDVVDAIRKAGPPRLRAA